MRSGQNYYRVEFTALDENYSYDIDALTGVIIDEDKPAGSAKDGQTADGMITDKEAETRALAHAGVSDAEAVFVKSSLDYEGGSTISEQQAKELALAQVPGASQSDIREFETDYDDGRIEYEGRIIYDGMEYEFEIDGCSSAFRSWEAEPYQ